MCWRRAWQPTPVFLPGEFHGWRSLVGYSPWGRKESGDFHFTSVVFTKDRLWGQISMRLTLSILMNKPGGFSSLRRSLTKAEFHLPGCHKTKANLCCNPSESWMPPSELQSNSCRCVQSVCFAELSWSNKEWQTSGNISLVSITIVHNYQNKETMEVKVSQLCPILCDPMDYIVHGILQARILEWVAFAFSRRSSLPRDWTQVSRIVGGFLTSWAIMEAQEYWSG